MDVRKRPVPEFRYNRDGGRRPPLRSGGGNSWQLWLGVTLDSTLSFDQHFKSVTKIASYHPFNSSSNEVLLVLLLLLLLLSLHSVSLLMDHGPLGRSTVHVSCRLTSSYPWLHWIIALPCLTVSSYLHFCQVWCLFTPDLLCFTANYLVWPALLQVTAVERRSCASGSTWRCLGLLTHILDPHILHIV